jgi:CxxC-x17-CxxC domain-containing protein
LESRSLVCAECGSAFEFTVAEQQHFEARGFASPKRCRRCRAAKRRVQSERAAAAPPAPRLELPPRERAPRQMYAAACTVCGTAAEVPFIPDGVRPVYCLPCLKQRTR